VNNEDLMRINQAIHTKQKNCVKRQVKNIENLFKENPDAVKRALET
jgi:hypothetical protein